MHACFVIFYRFLFDPFGFVVCFQQVVGTLLRCGSNQAVSCCPLLVFARAVTTFDPVFDSTPAAVVAEIDEDSAFTEAQDTL